MSVYLPTPRRAGSQVNIWVQLYPTSASLMAQTVKNLPSMQETQVRSPGWKNPWRRECQPTPVFLPGEFHGQRSLAGYSPWGPKEFDMTKWLTLSPFFVVFLQSLDGPVVFWTENVIWQSLHRHPTWTLFLPFNHRGATFNNYCIPI